MRGYVFRNYLAPFLKALRAMVSPTWLPLLMIFFTLYAPFILKYGWRDRDDANVDLPSFYAASVSVFEHGESPYDREHLQVLMGNNVHVNHQNT